MKHFSEDYSVLWDNYHASTAKANCLADGKGLRR
jgi:hypothetical protein